MLCCRNVLFCFTYHFPSTEVHLSVAFLTVPSIPEGVVATVINSTIVKLSWQPPAMPNGVITAYKVWYNQTLNCNGSLVSFSASVAGSVLMYTFTGLEENTRYVFYVSAVTIAGEGEAAMVMNRTREGGECVSLCVPMCAELFPHSHALAINSTARSNITCFMPCPPLLLPTLSTPSVPSAAPVFTVSTTATSIAITWQSLPPCDENGVITNYTIAYKMKSGGFIEIVVDAANRTVVISRLTPFTIYTIKMAASTSAGRGEFGQEVTVQTNESSKPPSKQVPLYENVTINSYTYTLEEKPLRQASLLWCLMPPLPTPVRHTTECWLMSRVLYNYYSVP